MKVPVLNMNGEQVDTVELAASIFEAKVNVGLMHQAFVRQQANARLGTHQTKTRSQVRRTTRKMYRQKGTGRARHGSRKAPIFVGGGVAHGPQPRDYAIKMPRKMRRAALRSALSAKVQGGDLVVVDALKLDGPKTRQMAEALDRLAGEASALVLLSDKNQDVERSTNNIRDAKTLRISYLNVRDLMTFDKVIMPLDALDLVTVWLGEEAPGFEEESDALS